MIKRLLRIELTKLKTSNYFRVLGILWLLAFLAIPIGVVLVLNNIENEATDLLLQVSPSDLPIFDFADIWQNLAWVYKFQTILLSFMVIISVTNEFDYKTVRQNVIDGFSRTHFWMSKVCLVLILSGLATGLLFAEGLIAGLVSSTDIGVGAIFQNIQFVGAYFLHVFLFLMVCLTLSILVRRAGFTIFIILVWNYVFENIAYAYNMAKFDSGVWDSMAYSHWLPLESASRLIHQPVLKYGLRSVQDYVSFTDLAFASGWIVLLLWASHRVLQKRDL